MPETRPLHAQRPLRALIVGSTMGAGHMTAAAVLAEHLERRGAQARVVDYLALPRGPHGRFTRAFYRLMVSHAPWAYGALMRAWARHPRLFERIASVGEGAYARGLAQEVEGFDPHVVISTYNLAGQLLGRLRGRGRLTMPVIAYVTDAGAHPYWVATGADLHLAPLPATAAALATLGAARVEVVDPLVKDPAPVTRGQARRRLGVPANDFVVLVNGGSWGVGAVSHAARSVASTSACTYVLCGHSAGLATSVGRLPGCHAVGWTDAVTEWVRAADVVVDSAGGTTCWEALVAGTPVVVHRPLAGHGLLNAEALRDAGLAAVSFSGRELEEAVRQVRTGTSRVVAGGRDAADAVVAST